MFAIVGSMLAHRLRRWPNIEPTMGQCPVFAENTGVYVIITLCCNLVTSDGSP